LLTLRGGRKTTLRVSSVKLGDQLRHAPLQDCLPWPQISMNTTSAPLLLQGHPDWPEGHTDWSSALGALGGPEAARRTRGPFAVAGTGPSSAVTAAVDRFAQETLCWRVGADGPKLAARADELGATELDPQAIYDYLFFHVIPAPRTIFRGVHRLPAGHVAQWNGKSMDVSRYASLTFAPQRQPDFEALKAEFRRLLHAAVTAELGQGTPACFLSGGTDSSTVAGQIKAITGEVHTYSIGFDAEGYDEMEFARIAARHFGATHHEYYVTPDDLVQHIAKVAASFDQPFGNSSALPAYCCALRAREDGVQKLIAGDGGDELFGGNTRYASQRVYGHWDSVPGWVRSGLVKPVLALPGADRIDVLRRGRNYVRDAELGLPDRLHQYNLLLKLGVQEVLCPEFRAVLQPESVFEQQRQVWAMAQADNELDLHLAFDWRYTVAESDLPKVRGATELAGVQVGYPLLDGALTDFSMTLPTDYKLKGDRLRWFFKEALRGFLPDAILAKEKKGFGLPFGVWANRHAGLRDLASDSLNSFATRGVVRPAFVKTLLKDHLPAHPGYYGEMVWILMMLEQWLRHHAPDWRHTPT
jgi:asparagine synthase (glutamine-hydrolysing)